MRNITDPSGVAIVASTAPTLTFPEARFAASEGSFRVSDREYRANGAPALIAGSFHGEAAPSADGSNVELRMGGDMTGSTLSSVVVPIPSRSAASPFAWAGLMGLGAVVGVTITVGVMRGRRARDDVAFFTHYASLAEDQFEYALALDWIQAAREIAPADATLAMTEGYLHGLLGQTSEALDDYATASSLDPRSGEADFWASVLATRSGRPEDHARAFDLMSRALSREPIFVSAVSRDPLFQPLRGPEFDAVIQQAVRRVQKRR